MDAGLQEVVVKGWEVDMTHCLNRAAIHTVTAFVLDLFE